MMKMKGKKLLWLLSVLVFPITYSGIAITGNLEPANAPGSTMRTLEELQPSWGKKITDTSKRFETVLDGAAVLDKETGLVWEKAPGTTRRTWSDAIKFAYNSDVGGRGGWRLPTIEELRSLIDPTQSSPPPLPIGHPFTNVQSNVYWSSNTDAGDSSRAWLMSLSVSVYNAGTAPKDGDAFVWYVRGGHGHNGQ